MKNKLVSVVIPVYNEEKDISDCIISLGEQSYKNIEIIIVDDGSTDETLKTAEDAARKSKLKLKVLKQNHQGPGKARNLGAENALGEILIFIDADMTFDKDYIKNLIKPILEDKTGMVIGTTHDYEVATNTDKVYSNLWGKVRVSKENAKDVKIFRAIKKDKFLELGGFDKKYGYADDQTFWFKYGIKPLVAEGTTCYHRNPETLRGTFKQARWIGASWKERFLLFRIPFVNYILVIILFLLFPFMTLTLAIRKNSQADFSKKLFFYFNKLGGYDAGIFRAVFLNKNYK